MKKYKERRIYLSDEEWEKAKSLAKGSGRTTSAYFRSLLELKIPRQLPPEEYHYIYRALSAIGNNINQMAVLAHKAGNADYAKFESALDVIYDLRKRIVDISIMPEDMIRGLYSNETDNE